MALAHFSKIFAVDDCKIAKMTADPAAGTATYGSLIDVPGIKTVEISGNVDTKELRGDNQLLDKLSILKDVQIAISHAKLSLDALAAVIGGAVTDTGTTPAQKAQYKLLGTDRFGYFKLEARTPADGVDYIGGDGHFRMLKCVANALPSIGNAEEDYRIVSFGADAIPRISDNDWIEIDLNETAAAIA